MIRIGGIMQKSKYYEEIALPRFPDGTLHLTLRYIDVSLLSGIAKEILISWNYEGDEEMAAILFLTKHFQRLGYEVSLNMPYIPNARQDRVKKEEDVFTLKYFAEFINSLNFCKVYVLDPHSNVSMALIDNIVVESPESYCAKAIKKIYDEIDDSLLMAFYPDEGAMKRYSENYGLEYAYAAKNRDWQTGKILGLEVIGNATAIKGRNIIIIDDICSKGGTFYYSAKKLKELGANKIFLFITHCEKTVFEGELFKSGLIDKLFTTDSIFTSSAQEMAKSKGVADKIEVIPLV